MFASLCRRLPLLAFGACLSAFALSASALPGTIADRQARYIATHFPGRMADSPAEMLSADYIHQQFTQMGYQSDIRAFNSAYIYTSRDHRQSWHRIAGSTVIAAHKGEEHQQIIIIAHHDTYMPLSDADAEHNLGGLTLQGIDDNALGVGVLLELAERLKETSTRYTIRFIATSGEEEGRLGAKNMLERMNAQEQKDTLLVINLDNLVIGDHLYFNSGENTPVSVRKLTRDRALAIAHSEGIAARTNPGLNAHYPEGTSCCNDAAVFDSAGIPTLSVEATNWSLGEKNGYQQRQKSADFPEGVSWHDPRIDNQQHIDKAQPGRIAHRARDVVNILLPLVRELAQVEEAPNEADNAPSKSAHRQGHAQ